MLDKNGTDFKELVDKKLEELKKQSKYQDKSAEELLRIADSEVIADGCETMLQDSKLLENLIEENPSVGKKIINAVKKIIAQIRAYFKEYSKLAKTEYGQAVLEDMEKTENDIQALYDKAVAEGIKATNAGVENANVQFSTRENLLFENNGKNESGDILKVTYDNIDKIPNKLTFSINEDFTFQSKNKSDDIFNYFKNIGGKAVNPDIGVVELNKAGSKSTLFHGFGKEKLASVYGIKDVIEKGVIISHVSNYNDKGYDRYIICGKGSLFGNNETYISVVVKSYPMNKNLNNKFYLHEVLLLEAKKETDSHILTGSQLSDKPVSESVSTNIIPNSSENSNSSSQQNSDRFDDRVTIDDLLDDYGDSDRVKLARAMKNLAKNDFERSAIKRYQDNVAKLDAVADELIEVNEKIKELTFTKDADRSQLSKLREQKAKLENKIAWWDKKLITSFETAKPLRDLFARGRKEVERKQKVKSDKRFKEYKDWQKKRAVILGQGARISQLYH